MNSKIISAAAAALAMTIAVQAAAQDAATEQPAAGETGQRVSDSDETPRAMMMQDGEAGMMGHMTGNAMMDERAMMMDAESMTEEQRESMRGMMKSCRRMMMAMSADHSGETPDADGR